MAVGLALIFSILRLINFAHGDVMMIAAYLAAFSLFSGGLAAAMTLGSIGGAPVADRGRLVGFCSERDLIGVMAEARDPDRLAAALRALWTDDRLHERLVAAAVERATWERRTWAEVADATRRVYAAVGLHPG